MAIRYRGPTRDKQPVLHGQVTEVPEGGERSAAIDGDDERPCRSGEEVLELDELTRGETDLPRVDRA